MFNLYKWLGVSRMYSRHSSAFMVLNRSRERIKAETNNHTPCKITCTAIKRGNRMLLNLHSHKQVCGRLEVRGFGLTFTSTHTERMTIVFSYH